MNRIAVNERAMHGKKILVIDDDPDMLELVRISLSRVDARVYTAANGQEGLRQFYDCRPHLVILDVMMPGMDGWELCPILRQFSNVPIIFLTALGNDEHVVRGLDAGAVDYVAKPFSTEILLARVQAALRQADRPPVQETALLYSDGYLTISLEKRQVWVRGKPVDLTPTEYRLLAYLSQHADQILAYEQILAAVWGHEYREATNYVHVYIRHLRRKLEPDARQPIYLLTEHGFGYRFARQDRPTEERGNGEGAVPEIGPNRQVKRTRLQLRPENVAL
jgi:two-component system KDP operon response regulator KdpE